MEATQGCWHELEHFAPCIQQGRQASTGTLEFALDLQRAWARQRWPPRQRFDRRPLPAQARSGHPPHRHRGHGEVLVVGQGRIRHTGPGRTMLELEAGDMVSIPAEVPHRAENDGEGDALLMVAYPVSTRDVIGE